MSVEGLVEFKGCGTVFFTYRSGSGFTITKKVQIRRLRMRHFKENM
jgi:hypothetical protein